MLLKWRGGSSNYCLNQQQIIFIADNYHFNLGTRHSFHNIYFFVIQIPQQAQFQRTIYQIGLTLRALLFILITILSSFRNELERFTLTS